MNSIPTMVDMRKTQAEKAEDMSCYPTANVSDYDYGLSICLNNDSLEKLDLDTDDVEVGDFIHIHALAKVTSISKRDTDNGSDSRIELVMTHISAEDEDEENEEEEDKESPRLKMYKK